HWLIHSRRKGLIACKGLNSLSGSHQRLANALNLSSSAVSALTAGVVDCCAVMGISSEVARSPEGALFTWERPDDKKSPAAAKQRGFHPMRRARHRDTRKFPGDSDYLVRLPTTS